MNSVILHTGLHHHPARSVAESEGSDSRPYLGGVDGSLAQHDEWGAS